MFSSDAPWEAEVGKLDFCVLNDVAFRRTRTLWVGARV